MSILNNILKEIKDVPSDRLEEVYQFVHSISTPKRSNEKKEKKILSFSNLFSDFSDDDYKDFIKQTKKTRKQLFNRSFEI